MDAGSGQTVKEHGVAQGVGRTGGQCLVGEGAALGRLCGEILFQDILPLLDAVIHGAVQGEAARDVLQIGGIVRQAADRLRQEGRHDGLEPDPAGLSFQLDVDHVGLVRRDGGGFFQSAQVGHCQFGISGVCRAEIVEDPVQPRQGVDVAGGKGGPSVGHGDDLLGSGNHLGGKGVRVDGRFQLAQFARARIEYDQVEVLDRPLEIRLGDVRGFGERLGLDVDLHIHHFLFHLRALLHIVFVTGYDRCQHTGRGQHQKLSFHCLEC